MRFLHTADLHIGKRLFDVNLAADQRAVLHQIADIAKKEQCDAVLIAGDIYDKPTPSAEAMGIFDTFVSELVLGGISVYAISGNHDSGERVNYLSGLIEKQGIVMRGKYEGDLYCKTLSDEYGELDLYLLPFIKPIGVKVYFPEEEIATYEEALRTVLGQAERNPDRRSVLVSHQFVMGASTCDSEEFAIGGLDAISFDAYEGFDYVALGHIHGGQKIKKNTLRYSGTPLKYSFSEALHKKSVTIVEVKEKGDVTCRPVPLSPIHDLRIVKGNYEELMDMTYSEDYVQVIVTDEEVMPDARVSLLAVFPNMLKFSVENSRTSVSWEATDSDGFENKSPLEMMEEFYCFRNNAEKMGESQREVLTELLEELEGGGA
ncbi:MAG: exonuclease SbcCD subunit D [Lachnospiraceae bacterium]|nr:exonuclease SbcCD subunit D [Lachnospiraceae bacterium]